MVDKGVLSPVGPVLGKEQSFTEQTPLVADDRVQRVPGIVSIISSSLSSVLISATVTRESSFVPTTEPGHLVSLSSLDVSILDMPHPPEHHSIKEDTGNHRLVKHC